MVHKKSNGKVRKKSQERPPTIEELVDLSLAAFVQAGTLDLSLDQLTKTVGISKRMLVHYFSSRENLEEKAISELEKRLRSRFAPQAFSEVVTPKRVVVSLWDEATAPENRGLLLLTMDISRRAWRGSDRARAFYNEQHELWVKLLLNFISDRNEVEELLQLFQGALFSYLITRDRDAGRSALVGMLKIRGGCAESTEE